LTKIFENKDGIESHNNNYHLPHVEELTLDQETKLEKNIIWVFGSRRSGTTWLAEQLLSFNTLYMHEPNLIAHFDFPIKLTGYDFKRRLDERKTINGYFFSDKFKNTWRYYLRKLILHRIHAQFHDLSKKIIVKEPSALLDASDILAECTPNSKKIILLRDGRDIIDSLMDGRQPGGWLAKKPHTTITEERRPNFIKRRSHLWVHQMAVMIRSFDHIPPNLRFLVKYEDLLKNTKEILTKSYNFLEIDIAESEIEKLVIKYSFENILPEEKGEGKFVRSAISGLWKEHFSEEEKSTMNEIMGDTLKQIGYEL